MEADSWVMAILEFDESTEETVVLRIVPQGDGNELVVIHRHPRPAVVKSALQLTHIGLQAMYKLVEVLRGWPKSITKVWNSCRVPGPNFLSTNELFLQEFAMDVWVLRIEAMPKFLDEESAKQQDFPDKLVKALLLMNVDQHPKRGRWRCMMCNKPRVEHFIEAPIPLDLEVRSTNTSGGYWTVMGISLIPGIPNGSSKLCWRHAKFLSKVFKYLLIGK